MVWTWFECSVGARVMKNWLPFVPGPELAIASRPGTSKFRFESNSSLNRYPGSPIPVPTGSPPWIMKSGITRWKIVPLYSGLLTIFLLVAGLVHVFVPSARAMKLATANGSLLVE